MISDIDNIKKPMNDQSLDNLLGVYMNILFDSVNHLDDSSDLKRIGEISNGNYKGSFDLFFK